MKPKATPFILLDQDGNKRSLSDYQGRWLVLYFYPKDDTPGCTKEACGFRDNKAELDKREVVVVGISKDSPSSHRKFKDKYTLPFTLLSDPNHQIIARFGAWKEKTLRQTYLINPQGEIVKEYKGVNPQNHAKEILKDLDKLAS